MKTSGLLLIHKPPGPTSHDVVNAVRRITGIRRVGHGGTLDPFAEGLLLVGVGREATRNLGKFARLDKRYSAVLRLGYVSDTYDRTGKKSEYAAQKSLVIIKDVEGVIVSFIGKQKQIPPQFSAKKVRGEKAYERARAGKSTALKPHDIEIYDITDYMLLSHEYLSLNVHCSSGTYIRTLGHDIGRALGQGAYVEQLTRTALGLFSLDEAVALDMLTSATWQKYCINFKTVMAGGTFEIFHPGHRYFLREAKKLGERLVVVVARDATAERLRGKTLRYNEDERRARITALDFVDEAVLGDSHDPYESVRRIKPDIIALGYDQHAFVRGLPGKIKEFGLKTKIARIAPHHPEQYKSSFL